MLDSTIQWVSIWETKKPVGLEIHLVGSAIRLLNNWGQMEKKKKNRKKQLKVSLTLNTIQN